MPVPLRAEDMPGKIYGRDYARIPAPDDGHRKHAFYVRPVAPSDSPGPATATGGPTREGTSP